GGVYHGREALGVRWCRDSDMVTGCRACRTLPPLPPPESPYRRPRRLDGWQRRHGRAAREGLGGVDDPAGDDGEQALDAFDVRLGDGEVVGAEDREVGVLARGDAALHALFLAEPGAADGV